MGGWSRGSNYITACTLQKMNKTYFVHAITSIHSYQLLNWEVKVACNKMKAEIIPISCSIGLC